MRAFNCDHNCVVASLGDRYVVWFYADNADRTEWTYVPVVDGVQGPYDTWALDFDGDADFPYAQAGITIPPSCAVGNRRVVCEKGRFFAQCAARPR